MRITLTARNFKITLIVWMSLSMESRAINCCLFCRWLGFQWDTGDTGSAGFIGRQFRCITDHGWPKRDQQAVGIL